MRTNVEHSPLASSLFVYLWNNLRQGDKPQNYIKNQGIGGILNIVACMSYEQCDRHNQNTEYLMRNFLSALARALRGAVSLPFWVMDNTWSAFKYAFGPRVNDATYEAASDAQQVLDTAADPQVAEMKSVVDALRIIVVNGKRSADDCLPMQLDNVDSRWSDWLSRLDAPQAQRALNSEKSRPGALGAHRSGEMSMIGIPRIKSEKEYKAEEFEALAAAHEEFLAPFRDWTDEQDEELLRPFNDMLLGKFPPHC
jgi:hypothetical protein